jgi:hypothetical protein
VASLIAERATVLELEKQKGKNFLPMIVAASEYTKITRAVRSGFSFPCF